MGDSFSSNLIQPTRIFEWRKHRIRFDRDSHKISQQWAQKYFDKYTILFNNVGKYDVINIQILLDLV